MGTNDYLAIDPGNSTGWASFDENGVFTNFGKIKGVDKFLDWLEDLVENNPPKLVIMEQYRNRPGAKNAWSTGPTQQHIGAISRVLRKKDIKIVLQDPSPSLVIGLRFLGLYNEYRNKHVPDHVSAMAHGTYYLRKAGIQKSESI